LQICYQSRLQDVLYIETGINGAVRWSDQLPVFR
jgi:hypothetical protein